MLEKARQGLQSANSLQNRQITTAETASGPSTVSLQSAPDLSVQARIFKDLCKIEKTAKFAKILFNIQLAAFHLSFMLRGVCESDQLVRSSAFFEAMGLIL